MIVIGIDIGDNHVAVCAQKGSGIDRKIILWQLYLFKKRDVYASSGDWLKEMNNIIPDIIKNIYDVIQDIEQCTFDTVYVGIEQQRNRIRSIIEALLYVHCASFSSPDHILLMHPGQWKKHFPSFKTVSGNYQNKRMTEYLTKDILYDYWSANDTAPLPHRIHDLGDAYLISIAVEKFFLTL